MTGWAQSIKVTSIVSEYLHWLYSNLYQYIFDSFLWFVLEYFSLDIIDLRKEKKKDKIF